MFWDQIFNEIPGWGGVESTDLNDNHKCFAFSFPNANFNKFSNYIVLLSLWNKKWISITDKQNSLQHILHYKVCETSKVFL